MRIALLADIHGNIEALDACLKHARNHGAERFVVLGDLVGYGADPGAVIDRVAGLGDELLACVLGNHDAAALGVGMELMNDEAQEAIAWTVPRLTGAQLAYLRALPVILREDNVTWVHASAEYPDAFLYISSFEEAQGSMRAAGTDFVFCGHSHDPVLFYNADDGQLAALRPIPGITLPAGWHRPCLGIVGSCGQPRDGLTGAWYALFDRARGNITYYRVPYDHHATAAKIRAAGLPERFAIQVEGLAHWMSPEQ